MDVVIIPRDARLNRHENALVVTSDSRRKTIPLNGIKHIVCMGNGSITIPLLKDMGRRGIRFTVLDAGGRFLGAFEPEEETPSGRVRVGQAQLFLDEIARLTIARAIVGSQIKSMRGLLQRYRRNGTTGLDLSLEGLQSAIGISDGATSIEILMGAEGHARAFLHDAFGRISPDAKLARRVRRPPPDPVNCLMSFFNMLLYSACANELAKTHLDRSVSFLHSPGTGRRSLSIDMAETFRPILSDALLLSIFRRRQIDESWLKRAPGVCLLSEKGRIKATERFWSRIEERHGNLTLRQLIHRQCLSLEREALGIGQFRPFMWRG
ncbi:MAG: CRISPR-associated endonuclease Cas1 [Acidobacteriota bacterium]|nr:CRISPR-associated endonuclease Cas1 [Acidobacteriota bacterium]